MLPAPWAPSRCPRGCSAGPGMFRKHCSLRQPGALTRSVWEGPGHWCEVIEATAESHPVSGSGRGLRVSTLHCHFLALCRGPVTTHHPPLRYGGGAHRPVGVSRGHVQHRTLRGAQRLAHHTRPAAGTSLVQVTGLFWSPGEVPGSPQPARVPLGTGLSTCTPPTQSRAGWVLSELDVGRCCC